MVKRIVVELENAEHEELSRLKGKRTWKQVLVEALKGKEEAGKHE